MVPDGRVLVRTADQVVAAVFSVSSSAPHLFADRLPRSSPTSAEC